MKRDILNEIVTRNRPALELKKQDLKTLLKSFLTVQNGLYVKSLALKI